MVKECSKWLSETEQKLPDNPKVQGEYFESQKFAARWLRSLGKNEEADILMKVARELLDLLPSSALSGEYFPNLLIRRANEFARQQKWSEATGEFVIGVDSAEDTPWAISTKRSICRAAARAPQIFDELKRLRPNETTIWIGHAQYRALCNNWKTAAEDYSHVIEKRPVGDEWFEYAYALVLLGDQDGYERLCKNLADRIGNSADTYNLFILARTCSISQLKSIASEKICDWADRSLADRPPWKLTRLCTCRKI
jgi:tetratricopeptide (TPR) repeat protein